MGTVEEIKTRWENIKTYYFVGRNYERADLRNKDLRGVNLTCGNFRGADLSGADLRGAILICADLSRACLHKANLEGANLCGADLTNAYCKAVNFNNTKMWNVVMKGTICKNATFYDADLTGLDMARAEMLGARFDRAVIHKVRNVDHAIFQWYWNPILKSKPIYDIYPGCVVMDESAMGSYTMQENAGMGQSGREYINE